MERLDWYNREYLKKLPMEDLEIRVAEELEIQDEVFVKKITPIIVDRINKISDIRELKKVELAFLFKEPEYAKEILLWRKEQSLEKTKKHLEEVVKFLNGLGEGEFVADKIKKAVWDYAEKEGRGNVLWPMRAALTGLEKSPDPFVVAEVIGKEKTIQRLKYAVEKI